MGNVLGACCADEGRRGTDESTQALRMRGSFNKQNKKIPLPPPFVSYCISSEEAEPTDGFSFTG